VPVRARLAVLLAATLAVAGAFFATLGRGDDAGPAPAGRFAGGLRPAGIPPADFRLRDQDGRVATLREYRGKVVVVTFLYTTCRDTCPLTADQIRLALDDLGHDVPVIAVSVDPENDTPARARAFSLRHGLTGRMRWALGDAAALQRLWRAFGIAPQTRESEHTASTVVLDGEGRQRSGFAASVLTPEGLAHDIALLEAETR